MTIKQLKKKLDQIPSGSGPKNCINKARRREIINLINSMTNKG